MIDYKKCEEEFAKARTSLIFKVKCKKMANNTYLFKTSDSFNIRFHDTDIVEVDENNNYHVRNGGWWTRSTLERINRYLPIRFWQNNSKWSEQLRNNYRQYQHCGQERHFLHLYKQ